MRVNVSGLPMIGAITCDSESQIFHLHPLCASPTILKTWLGRMIIPRADWRVALLSEACAARLNPSWEPDLSRPRVGWGHTVGHNGLPRPYTGIIVASKDALCTHIVPVSFVPFFSAASFYSHLAVSLPYLLKLPPVLPRHPWYPRGAPLLLHSLSQPSYPLVVT